jgi:hypothetical protein
VPTKDREAVVATLLANGFAFSDGDQSQLVSANPSPTATSFSPHAFTLAQHGRAPTQSSSNTNTSNNTNFAGAQQQQPPSSVADLQERTFALLRQRRVTPCIDPGLTLVQCTGIRQSQPRSRGNSAAANTTTPSTTNNNHTAITPSGNGGCGDGPSWIETVDTRLYAALCAALTAQPRFLSLTLAPPPGPSHDNYDDEDGDPPSLLLDRRLLGVFGSGGGGALAGPTGDEAALVPIFLDLADLPVEAAGIVCGVAGRLVREMGGKIATGGGGGGGVGGAELSYLSTARAGAVILSREQAAAALEVLGPLLAGGGEE